ncbi:MAG: hypothetical protein ABI672_21880, partial [Vicinamibacteria bacterium]
MDLDLDDWELGALISYYQSKSVRSRIAEYCGGSPDDFRSFTARGLALYGGIDLTQRVEGAPVEVPVETWPSLFKMGADVCRSLDDSSGTLIALDVDYMNHGDACEPYRDPTRTFERLEPVYATALALMADYGIKPLTLMTGRGYHLIIKAEAGGPFEASLKNLGRRGQGTSQSGSLPSSSGANAAHQGAGLLVEHLAHEICRSLAGRTEVPLTLLDLPPVANEPFICLDLSAYGDVIGNRSLRCAFSGNQKARMGSLQVWPRVVAVLPRHDETRSDLIRARADLNNAADLAETSSAAIPSVWAADGWLASYEASGLATFHRYFDRVGVDAAGPAPAPFLVPQCALRPLVQPNDALLEPGSLRTVALTLWARGYHPREVAELISGRYASPDHWGDYWEHYDRATRAEFYVRIACGAIAGGIEDWDAFTCDAQRRSGYCTGSGCGIDLAQFSPGSRKGTS